MTRHEPNRRLWALEYIHGHPSATVREIMAAVGLRSPSAAAHLLGRLEAEGLLESGDCPTCGRHARLRRLTPAALDALVKAA